MERKEFLVTAGGMVTAAMLSSFAWIENGKSEPGSKRAGERRPDPALFNEPILKALALGLNAPNPHNTQAWKFKVINPKEAIFYVDEKRLLNATDPIARQIHIGCGCFIALFKIGASHLGFSAVVEYLPEGSYAFSEIGSKPVARLLLENSTTEEDYLYRHIFTRQTNRAIYEGSPLKEAEFNKMISRSKPEYSDVKLTCDPKKLQPMLEVLYKGMEVECYDWSAFDESRQWFRVKNDIAKKRDGLNMRVSGVGNGLMLWLSETLLRDYSKKVWHNEGSIEGLLKSHYDKVMSSKGVVTFTTANNGLIDWIQCGQDYARFQLAAHDRGFYLHPLSQVLQEYPAMKILCREFNQLMNVNEPAKTQMAVRIGRSSLLEYSYRRNPNDFLIKQSF